MFKPVNSKVDFPAMERDILKWWDENQIAQKYLKRNEGADKTYSFIDGPITANNPMGVHHAWGAHLQSINVGRDNLPGVTTTCWWCFRTQSYGRAARIPGLASSCPYRCGSRVPRTRRGRDAE